MCGRSPDAGLSEAICLLPESVVFELQDHLGIRQLRCGQAARLLRETDTPIAEISAYVGYPDSNYFIKVFKKTLGMTPSEYRKTR